MKKIIAAIALASAALLLTGCEFEESNPKPYQIDVKLKDGSTVTCIAVDDMSDSTQIETLDCLPASK